MATRSIVTSQPDIACDVCGRTLLRGEHSDVFLAGGQRRDVCELCAPRAVDEGWLRERDGHGMSVRPARQRRARNLFGRLRQLRGPASEGALGESPAVGVEVPPGSVPARPAESGSLHAEGDPSYDFLGTGEELATGSPVSDSHHPGAPLPVTGPGSSESELELAPEEPISSGDAKALRALEVFNAGEHPRRIAGIARSLGAPAVSVRPLAESGSGVAIVVAWELCWYRYEVDLSEPGAEAQAIAQGTELGELDREDRLANAAAAESGTLLIPSV
jgi:hypothetical protein